MYTRTLAHRLLEAGVPVNKTKFILMDEASQLKATDEALTKMMKFIADKYNAIDFSEIEKSAGDIRRFKYYDMILDNVKTLQSIYESSTDPGAAKYLEVCKAIREVMNLLMDNSDLFSMLYKSGNGVVQLLYTSLVAGCLYSTGTLVSNTIRFVTIDNETDCQVMFDEIPGTIKHVHIKNIMVAAANKKDIYELLQRFSVQSKRGMSESVTISGGVIAALTIGGIILLIPKIIVMIREIIYSVYYTRVRVADMLDMQEQLLRTNIESLEAGRGNKKVVARQKKIADKLEKWKNRIAVKMDTAEMAVKAQKKKEDRELDLDHNDPMAQDPYASAEFGSIMI